MANNAHFFIETATFAQTEAFGPVSNTEFRVTSKLTGIASKKAYSICKGVVLLQQQAGAGNEGKVNLILRPFNQPFSGLNIKYFVYRGLNKADFITGDTVNATGSDFLDKINKDFNDFNHGSSIPFKATFIGYNESDSPTNLLADYFFKESTGSGTTETKAFELPLIDIGKSLGTFAEGAGIDVVLDYGDYKHDFDNKEFVLDLNFARQAQTIITATNDPADKVKREHVLQFMDIAAFYGLFVKDGEVITANGTKHKGNDIYTNVLQSFATKNNWYIYLQSDRGRSYNFYDNYKISETSTNNLKLGVTADTLQETAYETSGWPLLINTQTASSAAATNSLFLQLVTDNNNNTALYTHIGTLANAPQGMPFANADFLRQAPDADGNFSNFTTAIQLTNPAAADGKNITGLSLVLYQGKKYTYDAGTTTGENGQPQTINAVPNFFDDIFYLIKAQPLLQSTQSSGYTKVTGTKLGLVNRYFNKQQQGIAAVQTLTVNDILETGQEATPELARVTYITEAANVQANVVSPTGKTTHDTKTSVSTSVTVAKTKTYELPDPYYYDLQLFTDSGKTITGVLLKTLDGSTPNKIIVGLTKAENETLQNLIPNDGSKINPRLFLMDLFEDGSELISPEKISYQKYKVGIVAEDATGKLKLYMPTNDVFVYSIDRNYHFSKGYSEFMQESYIPFFEPIFKSNIY